MMFDNFQAYDVQEARRMSREEGRLEGKIEGETLYLIKRFIIKSVCIVGRRSMDFISSSSYPCR